MNEMEIHTIADLQRYVWSYVLPKMPIRGLGHIYEYWLVALSGKPTPPSKTTGKQKIPISRYMEGDG